MFDLTSIMSHPLTLKWTNVSVEVLRLFFLGIKSIYDTGFCCKNTFQNELFSLWSSECTTDVCSQLRNKSHLHQRVSVTLCVWVCDCLVKWEKNISIYPWSVMTAGSAAEFLLNQTSDSSLHQCTVRDAKQQSWARLVRHQITLILSINSRIHRKVDYG